MRFVYAQAVKSATVLLVSLAVVLASALPASARPKFASIVVDARDGSILSADDADGLRHPASLTKMMTLYIVFQELKAGRLKLSTPLRVSRRAAAMAPSKLGLKPGSTITVEQAIKALVIKSANDAAAVVGENLAGGSESAFAARMTRVARSIGMRRTTFKNASGLPNPAQVTTARDMATLGLRLMRDYPQYYPYFRSTSFVFKGRVIRGHNRLVGRFPGTDGIKTGYVNASGYNLVTSTKRGGKRVVGVVIGATSSGRRNAHMMTIISRALPKADDGNTIAALAGSSKGVINPLARKAPVVAEKSAEAAVPEDDKDLLAAVAAEAAVNTAEEADEGDDSNNAPEVIEAKLVETLKAKRKIPFEIKKTGDLTVSSLPETYTVQIGMFPSKAAAQSALANMRVKNTDAYTLAVKKNGKTNYRVMISGVTAEAAKMSCEKASKLGKSCAVLNSQG
jgi:D-alanyl-D-alanine carboxypeptidase